MTDVVCLDDGGSAGSGDAEALVDRETAIWIKRRSLQEMVTLKKRGCRDVDVCRVKNMGIVRQQQDNAPVIVLNRVEVSRAFDFDLVCQIMVSDAEPCPPKGESWSYVNVLLFTPDTTKTGSPMLLPYVFQKVAENDLSRWRFVNSRLEYSDHVVHYD